LISAAGSGQPPVAQRRLANSARAQPPHDSGGAEWRVRIEPNDTVAGTLRALAS
jgi:hypothetical protein